jgi:hypothetical protein
VIISFIVYNLVLLCPLILNISQKKISGLYEIAYIILVLFSIIRFDIGFDYDGMVRIFNDYINTNSFIQISKEPTFFYLCKLFSFSERGYVMVLAMYFTLTIFFLIKVLAYYKIENEGLFVFITMCYMFETYDRVRQALAILVFLYSLRFIEKKKFKKFFLTILLATLFHYSAIVLIPFYWILKIRIGKLNYYIFFIVALVLFYVGVWSAIRYKLFSLVPIYGDYYAIRDEYMKSVETNTGLGVLFTICMLLLPIIFFNNNKSNRVIVNVSFFGALFFFFASGNLLLERFSQYFTFISFVAISIIMRENYRNKIIFSIVFILWFQASIVINRSGCMPYKTIFSTEFKSNTFREKIDINYSD